MKPIVIVPFASSLHGESYITSILELFRRKLEKLGLKEPVYTKTITSIDDIDESLLAYRDHVPLFLPITGGTERLMYTLATKIGYRRVVIFAHGEHNSLASAVSARYRLELEGVYPALYHCRSLEDDECEIELHRMIRVLTALSRILGSRVLLIGPYVDKPEDAKLFEELTDGHVDILSMDSFASMVNNSPSEYVQVFTKAFENLPFLVPRDKLGEVAKIYGALRWLAETGKYDALAINCFPYLVKYKVTPCLALALLNADGLVAACEGDLLSLTLMIISRSLTGYTGWIANSTAFKGRYAYFSHCTIALNMIKTGSVTSHFESGFPYGLAGELVGDIYSFVSISRDFTAVTAGIGRVVASGMLSPNMCRTQVVLELGHDAEEIPRVAMANHHVLVPGDVRKELRDLAILLGLDYLDYGEVIR